jgi:hypothetical protein
MGRRAGVKKELGSPVERGAQIKIVDGKSSTRYLAAAQDSGYVAETRVQLATDGGYRRQDGDANADGDEGILNSRGTGLVADKLRPQGSHFASPVSLTRRNR